MKVAGLDKDGDWRFGRNRASYIKRSDAIAQNVVTRLRCFVDDWFLDIDDGIDWYRLLGERGPNERILNAVEARVLRTEGVREITNLELVSVQDRRATINISYVDIFDNTITDRLEVGQ